MQSGESTQDASTGPLLGAFIQVVNFDMESEYIDEEVVYAGAAASFLPGWPYVYATQDFLATISTGSSFNATTSAWDSTSFILGFDISGDTSSTPRPYCFAEVPGTATFNSYSTDVYEGHLRILTAEYFSSENSTSITTILSILDMPPPTSDAGTEMFLTGQISLELASSFDSVVFVRFMEDWGYVETSIGPSFVYDLSDPSDPKTLGGLETSGYSAYLEPIKIDGLPHMLGVGMFLDETSWESSLKITVFDVSDPTHLKVKAAYVERGAYTTAG